MSGILQSCQADLQGEWLATTAFRGELIQAQMEMIMDSNMPGKRSKNALQSLREESVLLGSQSTRNPSREALV